MLHNGPRFDPVNINRRNICQVRTDCGDEFGHPGEFEGGPPSVVNIHCDESVVKVFGGDVLDYCLLDCCCHVGYDTLWTQDVLVESRC